MRLVLIGFRHRLALLFDSSTQGDDSGVFVPERLGCVRQVFLGSGQITVGNFFSASDEHVERGFLRLALGIVLKFLALFFNLFLLVGHALEHALFHLLHLLLSSEELFGHGIVGGIVGLSG